MASQYFSRELIDKYAMSGPRYTSYPTAVEFHHNFHEEDVIQGIKNSDSSKPLSIYIHIPFCDTLCYYCACNKVITKDYSKSVEFIKYLKREISLIAPLVKGRPVVQMHWGGGTPTFLNDEQIADILQHLDENFSMAKDDNGEFGIEIDPRSANPERIRALRKAGFNRISLGVQDINPVVQKAVHRIQPNQLVENVLDAAKDCGYTSTNLDLIYGLPFQTAASFDETLDKVLEWRPDRLSVFNYAHLPHLFMPQKRIEVKDLPKPDEKLTILENAIEKLTKSGYEFIGMDHFALPNDELAKAQKDGSLHRNFQGYTTHGDCDLISFGPSAISQIGDVYSQNVKTLDEYYQQLEQSKLPIWRGLVLDQDDHIRRAAIIQLICQFELNFKQFYQNNAVDFKNYFAEEMHDLEVMQQDGLINLTDEAIIVNPPGRLLIRNVCMVFDKYLRRMQDPIAFSKTI